MLPAISAPPLSRPVEELRSQRSWDVVVIGSGYGGAVAAARLTGGGRSVCLLERGKEWPVGTFPVDGASGLGALKGPLGLFDLRRGDGVDVLVGRGVGGTSLINANVALEPDPGQFVGPHWPEALRQPGGDELLRAGYERARCVLGAVPYPTERDTPKKLTALAAIAGALGGTFERPPLTVAFTDGPNAVGVHQSACVDCGNCCSGCNVGAKGTLAHNYLPLAVRRGAKIFHRAEVDHLSRQQQGRWVVHYRPVQPGRKRGLRFLVADVVVVAAGTLGSTEILLRSRRDGRVPLSSALGQRFSANGDLLGFAYDTGHEVNGVGIPVRPRAGLGPIGPTITGMVRPGGSGPARVVQEGAVPGLLGGLMAAVATAHVRPPPNPLADPWSGALHRTLTYLGMGEDDSAGVLELRARELRPVWRGLLEDPALVALHSDLAKATDALGGELITEPFGPSVLPDVPVTVHPLGGCAMADRAEAGVVDHAGRAYSGASGTATHPGLFVADGSVLPGALGVNPLLTITALAERTCALLAADRGWTTEGDQ